MRYLLTSFLLSGFFCNLLAGNSPAGCVVNAASQNCLCKDSCNGSANAIGSGGTMPYSYSWFPVPAGGQGTANASGLCVGTYTVQLRDAAGCSASTTITVAQPTQITYTNRVTQASCSSCCDGKDTIYPSGGTVPSYTFSWNPGGGNGPTAQNLCPGTYTCCIQDANHCRICAPISISFPTGIEARTEALHFGISPNPFHNSIKIENLITTEFLEFSIYNCLNQMVLQGKFSGGKTEIETALLTPGVYFLSIKTRDAVFVRKMVKD